MLAILQVNRLNIVPYMGTYWVAFHSLSEFIVYVLLELPYVPNLVENYKV